MKTSGHLAGFVLLSTLLHLAPGLSAAPAPNRVLVLGGSGDFVEVADAASLDLAGTLTLEAWINPSFVTPSGAQAVVSKRSPDGTAAYDLGLVGGIPSLNLNGVAVTGISTLAVGSWHHLAGTYDGTTARLFVDGVLVRETATTAALQASEFPLLIGRASYPGEERPFFGKIDEVRVWSVARTEAQVLAYLGSRLEGVEAGLVGYWGWDSVTAADGSQQGNNGSLKGNAAIVADDSLALQTPAFQKVVAGPVATDLGTFSTVLWGDYDNDGLPDLFLANLAKEEANSLWRNLGGESFQRVAGIVSEAKVRAVNGSWADFDNDGNLDLFVAVSQFEDNQPNLLYRNLGGGGFSRVTTGNIATDVSSSVATATADYDGDGDVDLFVGNETGRNNFLYRNNGDGTFTKITAGGIVNDGGSSVSAAWADYDNDGDFDLFVSNYQQEANFLYRNDGNGTFTRVTTGAIATGPVDSTGCAWGDYDNDGWIDLYVASTAGPNALYHNDGNGQFSRILSGSLVTDAGGSLSCAWGDFNHDGFLDLAAGSWSGPGPTALYRNNGGSNNWVKVRCVGVKSNRSGIGAKVRMLTMDGTTERWQLRQISGDGSHGGQNYLEAHFGLGAAVTVKILRIEWPSGRLQTFENLPANRALTIAEPPLLSVSKPQPAGGFEIVLESLGGFDYLIEYSEDLVDWRLLEMVQNVNGAVQVLDTTVASPPHRFYRAKMPSAVAKVIAGPFRNSATGHDYNLLSPANWMDSQAAAVGLGGNLVTLNDQAEHDWVVSAFASFGGVNRYLWIGLTDMAIEGEFNWISGEDAPFRQWYTGEPNNAGMGEDFVFIWAPGHSAGGFWNDYGDGISEGAYSIHGVVEVVPR